MKKNSLTTAVVAGIAGVAGLASVSNAVNLNPDGLGQVLIYPYYTVNAGNSTLLSVVNTTEEVKAVKVRFLEALNSREVLDFNLYLSPFDVWTAAVVSDASTTGPARLITNDTSCTAPAITTVGGEPFRNNFYGAGTQDDDGPNDLSRTRSGHIEMIEMGVVVDDGDAIGPSFPTPENAANLSGVDNVNDPGSRTFATWATHVDGVPLNCNAIRAAWAGGIWDTAPQTDIDEPTGGLFGAGSIVDVANGTNLSYNADAIDGFYTIANSGALHTDPGSTIPSLSQAQTTTLNEADSIIFDNGALITLDFLSGRPDAVSSVYMHDQIFNEFNSASGTLAESEWVVTFPTKRLHIELTTPAERRPFTDNTDDTDPNSQPGNANEGFVFDTNGSCEPISISYYDREEGPDAPPPILDFSPPVEGEVSQLELCYEANVVAFNQQAEVTAGSTAVLGASRTARNINLLTAAGTEVTAGWVAMTLGDLDNFLLDGTGTPAGTFRNRLFGLPVTGFWAANFVNTNAAPGLLANYSLLSRHRSSRDTETVTVSATGVVTSTGFAAS